MEATKKLSERDYDSLLLQLAPYVVKKPDAMSYQERFDNASKSFYKDYVKLTAGKIKYYQRRDTAELFSYEYRDLTSLYEHYKAFGGYVKRDVSGKIVYLNLLYLTPRCTKDELAAKNQVLFRELTANGNVDKFFGDKNLIYIPNEDVYYDTKRNRWDYTENSSWNFLEEARRTALPVRDSLN